MKRVRAPGERRRKDRFKFNIQVERVEGIPDEFHQLRCILRKLPSRQEFGKHITVPRASSTDARDSAEVWASSRSVTIPVRLRTAPDATVPTLHAPKLVELELQSKEKSRGQLGSLLETWRTLALFDLDLSLFTRAEGSHTVDVPLMSTDTPPVKLLVRLTSEPDAGGVLGALTQSPRRQELPASPENSRRNIPLGGTSLSSPGAAASFGPGTPGSPHMARSTSGNARTALTSNSMNAARVSGASSDLSGQLAHRDGGLPGLTTESVVAQRAGSGRLGGDSDVLSAGPEFSLNPGQGLATSGFASGPFSSDHATGPTSNSSDSFGTGVSGGLMTAGAVSAGGLGGVGSPTRGAARTGSGAGSGSVARSILAPDTGEGFRAPASHTPGGGIVGPAALGAAAAALPLGTGVDRNETTTSNASVSADTAQSRLRDIDELTSGASHVPGSPADTPVGGLAMAALAAEAREEREEEPDSPTGPLAPKPYPAATAPHGALQATGATLPPRAPGTSEPRMGDNMGAAGVDATLPSGAAGARRGPAPLQAADSSQPGMVGDEGRSPSLGAGVGAGLAAGGLAAALAGHGDSGAGPVRDETYVDTPGDALHSQGGLSPVPVPPPTDAHTSGTTPFSTPRSGPGSVAGSSEPDSDHPQTPTRRRLESGRLPMTPHPSLADPGWADTGADGVRAAGPGGNLPARLAALQVPEEAPVTSFAGAAGVPAMAGLRESRAGAKPSSLQAVPSDPRGVEREHGSGQLGEAEGTQDRAGSGGLVAGVLGGVAATAGTAAAATEVAGQGVGSAARGTTQAGTRVAQTAADVAHQATDIVTGGAATVAGLGAGAASTAIGAASTLAQAPVNAAQTYVKGTTNLAVDLAEKPVDLVAGGVKGGVGLVSAVAQAPVNLATSAMHGLVDVAGGIARAPIQATEALVKGGVSVASAVSKAPLELARNLVTGTATVVGGAVKLPTQAATGIAQGAVEGAGSVAQASTGVTGTLAHGAIGAGAAAVALPLAAAGAVAAGVSNVASRAAAVPLHAGEAVSDAASGLAASAHRSSAAKPPSDSTIGTEAAADALPSFAAGVGRSRGSERGAEQAPSGEPSGSAPAWAGLAAAAGAGLGASALTGGHDEARGEEGQSPTARGTLPRSTQLKGDHHQFMPVDVGEQYPAGPVLSDTEPVTPQTTTPPPNHVPATGILPAATATDTTALRADSTGSSGVAGLVTAPVKAAEAAVSTVGPLAVGAGAVAAEKTIQLMDHALEQLPALIAAGTATATQLARTGGSLAWSATKATAVVVGGATLGTALFLASAGGLGAGVLLGLGAIGGRALSHLFPGHTHDAAGHTAHGRPVLSTPVLWVGDKAHAARNSVAGVLGAAAQPELPDALRGALLRNSVRHNALPGPLDAVTHVPGARLLAAPLAAAVPAAGAVQGALYESPAVEAGGASPMDRLALERHAGLMSKVGRYNEHLVGLLPPRTPRRSSGFSPLAALRTAQHAVITAPARAVRAVLSGERTVAHLAFDAVSSVVMWVATLIGALTNALRGAAKWGAALACAGIAASLAGLVGLYTLLMTGTAAAVTAGVGGLWLGWRAFNAGVKGVGRLAAGASGVVADRVEKRGGGRRFTLQGNVIVPGQLSHLSVEAARQALLRSRLSNGVATPGGPVAPDANTGVLPLSDPVSPAGMDLSPAADYDASSSSPATAAPLATTDATAATTPGHPFNKRHHTTASHHTSLLESVLRLPFVLPVAGAAGAAATADWAAWRVREVLAEAWLFLRGVNTAA